MSGSYGNGGIMQRVLQTNLLLREKTARLGELLPCASRKEECNPCASVHDCQKTLDGFFEELLDFMEERFTLESEAMQMLPRTQATCIDSEAHREDHARLMDKLVSLFRENRPPRELKTAFRHLIETWLYQHMPTYDAALIQALKSE